MKLKLLILWPSFRTARAKPAVLSVIPAASPPAFSTLIEEQSRVEVADVKKEPTVRKVPPPKLTTSRPIAPGILKRAMSWLQRNYSTTAKRQLRVSDSVSLGDKRFVAIVHADGHKFLIGGGSSGVSLLTQLEKQPDSVEAHLPIHELTERSA
jgi:hypothetical protein